MPLTKNGLLREARRGLAAYLEPGEQVELIAQFYNKPVAMASGAVGGTAAILENRTLMSWFAALTDRRLIFLTASIYRNKAGGLAWADPRASASAQLITKVPGRGKYGAIEYRRPSSELVRLWYSVAFRREVPQLVSALTATI
jgi:hypothetical protein